MGWCNMTEQNPFKTAVITDDTKTHLNQVHVAIDATGFTVHQVFQVLAFVGVRSGVERYSHQRKQNLTQILFFLTFLTFPLFIWESSV